MDTQDIPELALSGGQLIVADELGNSSSGRNFAKGNGNHHQHDHSACGWPPGFALTLYCAADHRPWSRFHKK
jgi:hypothetical protein